LIHGLNGIEVETSSSSEKAKKTAWGVFWHV
jgi:hypothetical protein